MLIFLYTFVYTKIDFTNISENNQDYEPFSIQQDQLMSACPHCFCNIVLHCTNEVNKQQWWENEPHPGHVRKKIFRKETLKIIGQWCTKEMCGTNLVIFRKNNPHVF